MKPIFRIPTFIYKLLAVALIIFILSSFIKPKDEVKQTQLDSIGMGSSTHLRVGIDGLAGAYEQVDAMNIHWVREEIPWSEVQQIPGEFSWRYGYGATYRDFSNMLLLAEKNNINVVAVLSTGPVFLPHQYPDQPVNGDELVKYWQAYVQAVVDRYGNQIDYWEIGNEMNNPVEWGKVMFPTSPGAEIQPEPFLYARMLTTAYKIIKNKDKSDLVILGGLYNSPTSNCKTSPIWFLNELNVAGAWNNFDVIALHPFWQNNPPEAWMPRGPSLNVENGKCQEDLPIQSNLIGEIRKIREFSNSISAKPIWITELGWREDWLSTLSSNTDFSTDQMEANFVVRSLVPLISEPGVRKIFWYSLYEDPSNPGYSLGPQGQQVLKNLGRLLGDARSLGQFQQFSDIGSPQDFGIYEYRFRKEGRTILFAWTASGADTPYPVTFTDLPGKKYRAYAAESTNLSLDAGMALEVQSDQSLTIYINEFPVILIQENPNWFASIEHRFNDGLSNWWDNKQDSLNSWLGNQISLLSGKMLDIAEKSFFNLVNWAVDGLEGK